MNYLICRLRIESSYLTDIKNQSAFDKRKKMWYNITVCE